MEGTNSTFDGADEKPEILSVWLTAFHNKRLRSGCGSISCPGRNSHPGLCSSVPCTGPKRCTGLRGIRNPSPTSPMPFVSSGVIAGWVLLLKVWPHWHHLGAWYKGSSSDPTLIYCSRICHLTGSQVEGLLERHYSRSFRKYCWGREWCRCLPVHALSLSHVNDPLLALLRTASWFPEPFPTVFVQLNHDLNQMGSHKFTGVKMHSAVLKWAHTWS